MTTVSQIPQLLEMAPDGPARQRAGGTVEGMARAYLPRVLMLGQTAWYTDVAITGGSSSIFSAQPPRAPLQALNLTDTGSAHALLTALALALGLDPGVGALDVSWAPLLGNGWLLASSKAGVAYGSFERRSGEHIRHVFAPTVANEPDPIKALGLAVAHVLAQS